MQAKSVDERSISLDGDWRFASGAEKAADEWTAMPVPSNWNTYTEYADYIGDGWYEREAKVPSDWKGQRIYLKFDAVYDIADVWLDEEYLGQHTGGYTPFEFDVTELVKIGGEHTITVKANNEHVVGAWYQWGGISRSVSMFARDEVRLIRQKIEPLADLVLGSAQVKLLVTVENKCDVAQDVVVAAAVAELPDTGFLMKGSVPAGETVTFEDMITLNAEQTKLWHFDDPNLYNLTSTLVYNDEGVDMLHDRFGIRSVEIKPDGLYLNGEKVRLMGYNRVHDHRAYGNVEPRHLVRADIDMMKRSGANFSRLMHAPSAPELLDYCDEIGYMMWAEIPMWQTVYRVPMNTLEDAQKAPERFPGITMKEMMQRDWNHPSIIGWSPGNELRGEASHYVEQMRPFVKELDPTRFYANIHDQGFQAQSTGGYKGVKVDSVDILFMNKYKTVEKKVADVLAQHESIPHLPLFMSEFGRERDEALSHTHDFKPLWDRLSQEPYVIGGAIWTLNDYRSYWHKTNPHSQNRDWGVVDVWRTPKRFYYDLARLQEPVHSIDVSIEQNLATITIQPRAVLEIPSFTLKGYSLVHELIDSNGHVLEGGIHSVDILKPDDGAVEFVANWETDKAVTLVVSLVSATDYTVAERKIDLSSGEELPFPSYPEPANPELRKVYPMDRSFMLGVTSLTGDTGIEVTYGTQPSKYSDNLSAPVLGAIRVRDLENGKAYYGKVRRIMEDGIGPWSPEFSVTPDGGLKPDAPKLLGVVRGENSIAVRLDFPEKVSAYEVTLSNGEVVLINRSKPGLLMLPRESERLAIVGEHGISKSVSL